MNRTDQNTIEIIQYDTAYILYLNDRDIDAFLSHKDAIIMANKISFALNEECYLINCEE